MKEMTETISVVIPTYNMASFLPALWDSILKTGISASVAEILFVNDRSTDSTDQALADLKSQMPDKVSVLNLEKNVGRFHARLAGAKAARGTKILFLDSRLEAAPDFGQRLIEVSGKYSNVVGSVDIDVKRNVFCLYWERSHRVIFRRHFRDAKKPIVLTPENYDNYLKGTTVFLCKRALFLKACSKFGSNAPLNDDTYLMKLMVEDEPIVIHPDLRIAWVPREDAVTFLKRLWERGPSFVEYHVFEHRGTFFWVVLAGLIASALWIAQALHSPESALRILGLALLAAALSTVVLAKGIVEFFRMLPLHVAVILTFGFAIVRGIGVNLVRKVT